MANESIKVLFLEDEEVDALAIQRLIARSEDDSLKLTHLRLLQQGLDCLRNDDFDAVLLDLGLPDSPGGTNTIKAVLEVEAHIPIVVLTGLEDTDGAMEAIRHGAQEYLLKENIDSDRLLRAIRYAMQRVAHQTAKAELNYKNLQFATARKIQQRLFPKSAPVVPGYDIAGCCIPADETGGDFYDFFPLGDSCQGLAIGDASGHGLGPAMMVTQLRAVLRTLATFFDDVGEIVIRLQEIVGPDFLEGAFTTLMLMRIDPQTGVVDYASAGQPAFVLDADGNKLRFLEAQFTPVMEDANLVGDSDRFDLAPGEILLLYTDGITESSGVPGMFGNDRMIDVVRRYRHESAEKIVNSVLDEARNFSENHEQTDDMTIVVAKRLESAILEGAS